jgi:hypothetical protein
LPAKAEYDTLVSFLFKTVGKDRNKIYNALKPGGSTGFDLVLAGVGFPNFDYKVIVKDGQHTCIAIIKYKGMGKEQSFWTSNLRRGVSKCFTFMLLFKRNIRFSTNNPDNFWLMYVRCVKD